MKKILLPMMAVMAIASGVQANESTEVRYEEHYDSCYNDHNARACIDLLTFEKNWDNISDAFKESNIDVDAKDFFKKIGQWFKDEGKRWGLEKDKIVLKAGVETMHRGKKIMQWNMKPVIHTSDRETCWEFEDGMHHDKGATDYLESIFGHNNYIYIVGGEEGDGAYSQSTWKDQYTGRYLTIKTRCDYE